jgi:Zn finger protein HypA/HybF involved in hydrogenase expression
MEERKYGWCKDCRDFFLVDKQKGGNCSVCNSTNVDVDVNSDVYEQNPAGDFWVPGNGSD